MWLFMPLKFYDRKHVSPRIKIYFNRVWFYPDYCNYRSCYVKQPKPPCNICVI